MTNPQPETRLKVPVVPREGAPKPKNFQATDSDYLREVVKVVRKAREMSEIADGDFSGYCYTRVMYLMKRPFGIFGLSQDSDDIDDIGSLFDGFIWSIASKTGISISHPDNLVGSRMIVLYQRESESEIGQPRLVTFCSPEMNDLIDEGVPPFGILPPGDQGRAFENATSFPSYPVWF